MIKAIWQERGVIPVCRQAGFLPSFFISFLSRQKKKKNHQGKENKLLPNDA